MPEGTHRPLEGVRVLDLTRFLAGPYCTMMLADLGAEVLKIEPPEGDESRHQMAYRYGTETAYYLSINRNKQGLVLDLKRPDAQQVFYDLVAHSDVVVDNYRPGVTKRLGIDYDTLVAIKPDIICCSISAFGEGEAAGDRPAYDLVVQAMGGGMSITGEPGRTPVRMGLPMGDLAGGLFAAQGILAALYERNRSGKGQRVTTTLLSAQIAMHAYVSAYYWQSGQEPEKVGSAHASMTPYQAFETSDGWIAVVAHSPKFFANFCRALGLPALITDPRFADLTERLQHRDELLAILEPVMRTESTAAWVSRLVAADVPCGPVNSVGQALAQPEVLAENMVVHMHHADGFEFKVAGNPVKFSRTPAEVFTSPPRLGGDTVHVLQRLLSYGPEQIRKLADSGTFGPAGLAVQSSATAKEL